MEFPGAILPNVGPVDGAVTILLKPGFWTHYPKPMTQPEQLAITKMMKGVALQMTYYAFSMKEKVWCVEGYVWQPNATGDIQLCRVICKTTLGFKSGLMVGGLNDETPSKAAAINVALCRTIGAAGRVAYKIRQLKHVFPNLMEVKTSDLHTAKEKAVKETVVLVSPAEPLEKVQVKAHVPGTTKLPEEVFNLLDPISKVVGGEFAVDFDSAPVPETDASGLHEDLSVYLTDVSEEVQMTVSNVAQWHPISLSDADTLYQPVRGTSDGSIYHVVGISKEGVKVAARFKAQEGGGISIRVEHASGSLSGYEELLAECGLGANDAGHWSMHTSLKHKWLACRTVGSILGHMARKLEWVTPVPNFDEVSKYGH